MVEKELGYAYALFLQDWESNGPSGSHPEDTYCTIGLSRSDTLSVSGEFNDCSNKLSGKWSDYVFTRATWRITAEHILGMTSDNSGTHSIGARLMVGHLINGRKFRATWTQIQAVDSQGNLPIQLPNGGFQPAAMKGYHGYAMFESIEFNANIGDVGGYNISMIGTGQLKPFEGSQLPSLYPITIP